MSKHAFKYRLIHRMGLHRPAHFLDIQSDGVATDQRGWDEQSNLFGSVCLFAAPYVEASRLYPLYFEMAARNPEDLRRVTLEVCYYLQDFGIPVNCVDVVYDGGFPLPTRDTAAPPVALGRMQVSVCPVVYDGCPGTQRLALNYILAKQIARECRAVPDVDVYQRDHSFPVPNSINASTGCYAIPLRIDELLYLDANHIIALAARPRAESSLVTPCRVPQAAEWYANLRRDFQKSRQRQNDLTERLCQRGWEIPPCVRRLRWTDLDPPTAWETCRIMARFYASVRAAEDEIWYQVMGLCRAHGIADHPRLRSIVAFALENPAPVQCNHPLLQKLCPRDRCFLHSLMEVIEQPYLFPSQ